MMRQYARTDPHTITAPSVRHFAFSTYAGVPETLKNNNVADELRRMAGKTHELVLHKRGQGTLPSVYAASPTLLERIQTKGGEADAAGS